MPEGGVVLSGVELDRLLAGPEGAVYLMLHKIATDAVGLARAKVRPGSVGAGPNFGRRGHLRDSYVSRMMTDGILVGSPLPQAVWVEDGTEPHDIVPKTKKALRFYSVRIAQAQGKGPGAPLFFKRVHHPGTKAQHILAKSVAEAIEANLPHY